MRRRVYSTVYIEHVESLGMVFKTGRSLQYVTSCTGSKNKMAMLVGPVRIVESTSTVVRKRRSGTTIQVQVSTPLSSVHHDGSYMFHFVMTTL
jgi:hypothetical protein